jgi:hypothetical protein
MFKLWKKIKLDFKNPIAIIMGILCPLIYFVLNPDDFNIYSFDELCLGSVFIYLLVVFYRKVINFMILMPYFMLSTDSVEVSDEGKDLL